MKAIGSSFRDPSGYVFNEGGIFYRAINNCYKTNFQFLEKSGLYEKLLKKNLVISYTDVTEKISHSVTEPYKIILPEQISHISYPYEWCFSQLKDAALLTLKIQEISIKHGMSLKDASAYNIQFHNGLPIMIDTLSFEKYEEGEPWVAYRQFCQHFLAPLTLASYVDIKSIKLLQLYIDGIPLDYTVNQLPLNSIFKPFVFMHLYLHSRLQNSNSNKVKKQKKSVSKVAMLGLIGNLRSAINSLNWNPNGTEWAEYYDNTNYSPLSMDKKYGIIDKMITSIEPSRLWDIGGNTGEFTRLASAKGINSILFDIDYSAIEKSYRQGKTKGERNIESFVMDFTNPSPGIGWNNNERPSIFNRDSADMVLALALIHHLCISNNLPFELVVNFFSKLTTSYLVIEFVPKSDSQVERLLSTREDIFVNYNQKSFEQSFTRLFNIINIEKVDNSERTIYLMKLKEK